MTGQNRLNKITIKKFCIFNLYLASALFAQTQINDSIQTLQLQLDSIEKKLDGVNRTLEYLAQRETLTLAKLDALEKKISLTRDLLKRLATSIDLRTREINSIAVQLAQAQQEIDKRRELLKKRIFSIYKYSRVFPIQALLTSKNIPDLYRRAINLRLLSRHDKKLILETNLLVQEVRNKRQALLAAFAELESLRAQAQEKQLALEADRQQESGVLEKIRQEKQINQRVQQELQLTGEKLRVLLDTLTARGAQETTAGADYFERQKGKLPWPVRGTVVATFGSRTHPRYHTKTNNPGIDIKIESNNGQSVQVVAPGKVVFADRFIGYGNLVIVEHGKGYYTLYANLTTLNTTVGAEMGTGTTIGTVEDYLHFEIRKEGQPLNPLDYLVPR